MRERRGIGDQNLNKILVVRVGALGDTLMVTPAVRALHRRYPMAEIDFLCSEYAAPLLELNPNLSCLRRLHWRNLPYAVSLEKQRMVRQLRSQNYDMAVLLESAPRYRDLLERAGISWIRSFAEAAFDPSQHCIVNYLNAIGLYDASREDLDMELLLDSAEEQVAERLLRGLTAPRVGIHMGYGPKGRKRNQSKRLKGWSHDNFVQLIRMLLDAGTSIVLTGSAEDYDETEVISRHLPSDRARSIARRTTVRELAAVIKKLDLFISVDSGPAHMAAALGVPLVVLWGPGIFEQVRPLSRSTPIKIVRVSVPCAPCYGSSLKDACKRNICMEGILPNAVLEAAQSLLG